MRREHFFLPEISLEALRQEAIKQGKSVGTGYPGEKAVPTENKYMCSTVEVQPVSPPTKGMENKDDTKTVVPITTEDNQVHIFQHGCLLTSNQEFLLLRKKKKEIWKRRLTEISSIFLQGQGNSVTTALQMTLSSHAIPLFLLTMTGNIAVVTGAPSNRDRERLRIQQAVRHDDPEIISTGLAMLAAKTGNQAALLKYFAKYRIRHDPETADTLRQAAQEITDLASSIRNLPPTTAMIRRVAMGLEGKAASLYWRSAAKLLPNSFQFTSRSTQGARDVINQCLNYTYSLLYGEVWQAVHARGLDPCFGIMHSSLRDKGSLVYDIIEEFRAPFADRQVFSMIGRGFLPARGQDGMLLLKTRKALLAGFLKRWQKKMTWRSRRAAPGQILRAQVKALAERFQKKGGYKPFRMKW